MLPREVFEGQPRGYIFVAVKGDVWQDKAFETIEEAEEWLAQQSGDKYFSPTTYSAPRRRKENVLPSRWLWQDLDPVDPREIFPRPTIAWETSPGRYQALWKLDRVYHPERIESVNKALAIRVGADHGSWILTKVLRVPETQNFKYDDAPMGKLLWSEDTEYRPEDIDNLPDSVRRVLNTEPEPGERSDKLWYMEHELAKAGMSIEEIYTIVKNSPWNKYAGRRDEEQRLMHEIAQAVAAYPRAETTRISKLKFTSHRELMGRLDGDPGWLVEGFWTKNSHGIVAGEPKSMKSTLTLDFAVSVASGKPFLGLYAVHDPGPVIIIQNENAEWILKNRLTGISIERGLGGSITGRRVEFPPDLPIYYLNNQGFKFDNPEHRAQIEEFINDIKPRLVIFDPLYLMFDGDVNSAQDLAGVLGWVLKLKEANKMSVMLVHHWRKSRGATKRGGQRMLGSTTLHGWVESAWYVEAGDELTLEREFRAAQAPSKLKLRIDMGDMGDIYYRVQLVDNEELDGILNHIALHPGCSLTSIEEATGLTRRKIRHLLEAPLNDGRVILEDKKYTLASFLEDVE